MFWLCLSYLKLKYFNISKYYCSCSCFILIFESPPWVSFTEYHIHGIMAPGASVLASWPLCSYRYEIAVPQRKLVNLGSHTPYLLASKWTFCVLSFMPKKRLQNWCDRNCQHLYRYLLICSFRPLRWVNSLWPSDAIWRQGARSTLDQVRVCCLTAPSHYLTNVDLSSVRYGGIHLRAIS